MSIVSLIKNNKKGVALTYAVMVLLLLSAVVVAITALATTSYASAVVSASDDQGYYYAKSVGVAVKEQFSNNYNLSKITDTLDYQIKKGETPSVSGTYTIEDENYGQVSGTVFVSYAYEEATDTYDPYVLEVKVSCIINNALSVVTSVYSCKDDQDALGELENMFTDYDVVITDPSSVNFNFADANNEVNVYVYAGEDDSKENEPLKMSVNMNGMLTTTGGTTIKGVNAAGSSAENRVITGKLTSYGNLTLQNIGVGANIFADGDVVFNSGAWVTGTVYSRSAVTVNGWGQMHNGYWQNANWVCSELYNWCTGFIVHGNVVALDNVNVKNRATVGGNIYSRRNVTVSGYYNTADTSGFYSESWIGNTFVGGNIYSNGDVTVENGATVVGDIICNGNVKIYRGAVVNGNIYCLGNVEVVASAVRGTVQCKGALTLKSEASSTAWVSLVAACGFVHGGIGMAYVYESAADVAVSAYNICNTLVTVDSPYSPTVGGNLTVNSASEKLSGTSTYVTKLLALWVKNGYLYLLKSTAYFAKNKAGDRTYVQNLYGNASTMLACGLWQEQDFAIDSTGYIDMKQSYVARLNVGASSSASNLKNCYASNGCVAMQLWANDVYLQNMLVYGTLYAKNSLYTFGKGGSATSGATWTGDNMCKLVACTVYSGGNTTFGAYTTVDNYSTVTLGATNKTAIFTIGDNAKVYSQLIQGYANTTIKGGAELSDSKSGVSANAMTLKTYGALTVDKSTTEYRYGSTFYVSGTTVINGLVYNVYHFSGDFTISSNKVGSNNGQIAGKFFSNAGTSAITLYLNGKFGDVEVKGSESTVSVNGDLTCSGDIKINGFYKNPDRKRVECANIYVARVPNSTSSARYDFVISKVTGNAIVGATATSTTTNYINVTKDGSIGTLNSVNSVIYLGSTNANNSTISVKGVYCKSLTVQTKGKVTEYVYASGDVTVDKGIMDGDFQIGGNFTVKAGSTVGANSSPYISVGGVYRQTGGEVSANMEVKGSDLAASITGGTYVYGSIKATNGYVWLEGGSATSVSADISAKYTSKVLAEFDGSFDVLSGNLTVGDSADTTEYTVGSGFGTMYASGTVTWGGKAKGRSWSYMGNIGGTNVGAGGDVTVGSSSNRIKGVFGDISSTNGKVNVYAEEVRRGVYASGDIYLNASVMCGYYNSQGSFDSKTNQLKVYYGAKSVNGNIVLASPSNAAIMRGVYQTDNGTITISNSLNLVASLKAADIIGLEKAVTKQYTFSNGASASGVPADIYITAPYFDTHDKYELKVSLIADTSESGSRVSGSITTAGDLYMAYPVRAAGEIYVDGIFYYKGDGKSSYSTEEIICLGGVRCLNSKVTIGKDFKGTIDLPNVTSLTLQGSVSGLNAPNVTSFTIDYDIDGGLTLSGCKSLTVPKGRTIKGDLTISTANDAKLTNNGTVTGGVKCGVYYGASGSSVGGNVVALSTTKTEIYGKVSGSVYVPNADLVIGTSGATITDFAKTSGAYVYGGKTINATKVTFGADADYVSAVGNMTFTDCKNIPNVYCKSGELTFSNASGTPATIKSIVTVGKKLLIGKSDATSYQTVSGICEWGGTNGATMYANATVSGAARFVGSGNVSLAGTFGSVLHLANTGTASVSKKVSGNLYINSSSKVNVKSLTLKAEIGGDLHVNGTASGNMSSLNVQGKVSGKVYVYSVGSVTLSAGTAGAQVKNGTLTVDGQVSGSVTVESGGLIVNKAVSGAVKVHNGDVIINANTGAFTHTATSYPYGIQVGSGVTINGDFQAHASVVDNSNVKGKISVTGAYVGDTYKTYSGTKGIYFTPESGGLCWLLGNESASQTLNGDINCKGWLLINTRGSKKFTINGDVYCNQLNIDNSTYGTTGDLETYVGSALCCGSWLSNNANAYSGAGSTANNLVQLYGNVYATAGSAGGTSYKGTAYICNTTIQEGTLYSEGQTSMSYCILKSQNYVDDNTHCLTDGNSVSKKADGSMFVHASSSTSGGNYFYDVDTYSNVSVFYGKTWLAGGSRFYGVKKSYSSLSNGVAGNTATKLFYFGKGLELTDGAGISTGTGYNDSGQSVKIPSARTIVFVAGGDFTVGSGCFAGYEGITKSGVGSSGSQMQRKFGAINPGIFVSAGNMNVNGTCTLDIIASGNISITSGAVVAGHGYKYYDESYFAYFGGIFIAGGKISNKGWFNYSEADASGRKYWEGGAGEAQGKSSGNYSGIFTPYGAGYAYLLNNDMTKKATYKRLGYTYERTVLSSSDVSGTSQTNNCKFYTPICNSTKPSGASNYVLRGYVSGTSLSEVFNFNNHKPTGSGIDTSQKISATSASNAYTSVSKSVPTSSEPSVGQGGGMESSTGTLSPQKYVCAITANTLNEKADGISLSLSSSKKLSAPSFATYGMGTVSGNNWTNQSYGTNTSRSKTTGSITQNANTYFTADILLSLDRNGGSWNPRAIPYVWTMPEIDDIAKHELTMDNDNEEDGDSHKQGAKDLSYGSDKLTTKERYTGSNLESYTKKYIMSKRADGSTLKDAVAITRKPSQLIGSNNRAQVDIIVFESGVMPTSAMYKEATDKEDYFDNSNKSGHYNDFLAQFNKVQADKKFGESIYQRVQYWGDNDDNSYDVNWLFYACEDPLDPYKSGSAKDLHVILPQGLGVEFYKDANNQVTVIGDGRVFLYLQSGTSIQFYGNNESDSAIRGVGSLTRYTHAYNTSTGKWEQKTDGKLHPQLYIIGAGTNIDVVLESMNLMAYIYMPFGTETDLYGKSGVYGKYQKVGYPIASAAPYGLSTSSTKAVSKVLRNSITFRWFGKSKSSPLYGTVVADSFYYAADSTKLSFDVAAPDLSPSTIYRCKLSSGKCVKDTSTVKTIDLSTMLSAAPDISTSFLNWKYVGIRVD